MKTIYQIELNALSGINMYTDQGGWIHCSDNIFKLCDWAANLLNFDNEYIKEWGKNSNWIVTKLQFTSFKQIKKNDVHQFFTRHDALGGGYLNRIILSKDYKQLVEYLIIEAKELLRHDKELMSNLKSNKTLDFGS